MARFKYSNRILLFPIMIGLPLVACDRHSFHYTGDALSVPRPWLKNKRIFLDTGYNSTPRHNSPARGYNENAIVSRVTGMLAEMLQGTGATVEIGSRTASSTEIALSALQFKPDLIIGIRSPSCHGSAEDPSQPLLLLGGPRDIYASSFDFAVILMDEFYKIMDGVGIIASETASPGENSTILHDTASICPGVIGIPASYPGIDNVRLAVQVPYLEKLAEAYFYAISSYFKRGIPTSKLSFSCPVETTESGLHLIREENPSIIIYTEAGGEAPGIDEGSLHISLDGIPLKYEKIAENHYKLEYGNKIYPGRHILRYHFKNLRGQSSMRHAATFALVSHPGDRERLIREGTELLTKYGQQREGLAMLLSALSYGIAHDGIESLFRSIIGGFTFMGNATWAAYYRNELSKLQRVGRDSHSRGAFPSLYAPTVTPHFNEKPVYVLSGHCAAAKGKGFSPVQRAKRILDFIDDFIPFFDFRLEGK